MTLDGQLKLQAYLDGELNPDEARTMDALLASDSDAIALAEELRRTRDAIRGNELLAAAPPQRDFYWSQIEKQILAQPPRPTQPRNRRRCPNRRWPMPRWPMPG